MSQPPRVPKWSTLELQGCKIGCALGEGMRRASVAVCPSEAVVTRRSPYMIELSAQDRSVLEQRARCYTAAHHQVVRAKIVLMAADGLENTVITARLDTRAQVCRCGASGSTRRAWWG